MGKSAQLVRSLDKKLKGWDLKKAIKFSKDENPLLNQCTLESNTFEYEDLDWIEECA